MHMCAVRDVADLMHWHMASVHVQCVNLQMCSRSRKGHRTCENFCTTGRMCVMTSSFLHSCASGPQHSTASSRTESWSAGTPYSHGGADSCKC